jgi:hypothetical protein
MKFKVGNGMFTALFPKDGRWRHHSLTHPLTPYSTVLLEKLTGLQLVKKFPAFYGT